MSPACQNDQPGAVYEHTAHSAITAARYLSANVAAGYDPHAQATAELRLADTELDALVRGA
jgi:hypothetical protein